MAKRNHFTMGQQRFANAQVSVWICSLTSSALVSVFFTVPHAVQNTIMSYLGMWVVVASLISFKRTYNTARIRRRTSKRQLIKSETKNFKDELGS